MYAAALLKTVEDAGVSVLTLVEGVQDDELLASRLTRQEVARQSRVMLEAAAALPFEMREAMPEIDWTGMVTAGKALAGSAGADLDEALVFCARALTPALMMWLRVYQQQHPDWFKMQLS